MHSFRRASTSTLTPSSEDLRVLAKRSLPKPLVVVTKGKRYDIYIYIAIARSHDHVFMVPEFVSYSLCPSFLIFTTPSGGTVSSLPLSLSLSLSLSHAVSPFLPLFPSFSHSLSISSFFLSVTLSTSLSLSHSLT